ncbi:PadR family transcriptional regulator [Allofournierella massiliensis]|uniref:PadR family transcriptional regulator n=1 Tax=Allofournierella massiliensis TaxID=1650663 RepID=UPI0024B073AA|nr:PadR family transcriptional regulator [Fournierella massiliensis]
MGVSENLKRGVTELVLLSLLAQRDMYGYEMSQELQTRSGGKFILQESSMYPTLYRLEDKGYITVTKQQVGRRRTRMYYHLEPSGQDYLQSSVAEYLAMQEGIRAILTSCGMNEVEPV